MTQVPTGPDTPDGLPQGELEFITELCAVVAEQSELQPILDWLVHKSTRLLGADECTIKLLTADGDTAKTIIFDSRRSGPEAGSRSWAPAVKASVMGFLLSQPRELASPDLAADARFPGLKTLQTPVRALLALPLKVDGRVTGMIAVSNAQPGRQWTRHDVQLMSIVATHSASVIEKARLRVEAEEKRRLELEREAMEKDLRIARDIQMRLVPSAPLALGGWRADGRLEPAKQVGGDFFDYFPLDAERCVVTIADVAGKGVPAALLVSTVASSVRAFADGTHSPRDVVTQVNRAAVRSSAAGDTTTIVMSSFWAVAPRNATTSAKTRSSMAAPGPAPCCFHSASRRSSPYSWLNPSMASEMPSLKSSSASPGANACSPSSYGSPSKSPSGMPPLSSGTISPEARRSRGKL